MPWAKDDGNEKAMHKHIMSLPREKLQGNPQAVLQEIENWSPSKGHLISFKLPKIGVSRAELAKMSPPPKVLVELGTYVGMSAIAWGSILKDLNGGDAKSVKVICLEYDEEFIKIASDMIKLAGVDDVVQIVHGVASESLKKLKDEGKIDKIDVLFLDHFSQHYLPDLKTCEELKLFHEGSVVLADNMDRPDPPEYVKYVRAGGRGGEGSVKFQSQMVNAEAEGNSGRPMGVEVSRVVAAPA